MLEYKTTRYGSRLMVAPRFYASTKTCSACGHLKGELPLADRVFRRETCGQAIERDLNGARDLGSPGARSSPETQDACGAEGSGRGNGLMKPAAAKRESPSGKLAAPAAGNKRP